MLYIGMESRKIWDFLACDGNLGCPKSGPDGKITSPKLVTEIISGAMSGTGVWGAEEGQRGLSGLTIYIV